MLDQTELKAIFSVFDEPNVGHVPSSKLGLLLRASGLTPTQARVNELVQRTDTKGGTVSFDDYISMIEELSQKDKRLNEKDLENAFRVFDQRNTGFVQLDEIRRVLTSMGERLITDEVDEVLQNVEVADGRVDYKKFAKVLVS